MIGVDNKLIDGKYEYNKIQLKELESKYIYIPLSIITNTDLDTKRVGVFSYLRTRCGLDNIVGFTIPDMVEWCGMKPNKRTDKSNSKFLDIVDVFNDDGYITYLTDKSKSSYMRCKFHMDYFNKQRLNGYAVVYIDELEKIMKYKKNNSKDNTITNTTILLVFAYLRHKIRRRPNELKPEERTNDGIQKRKERIPEAYDNIIDDIANEIGISSKTLLKIIDILEEELELIVTDRAYRIKNEDGEFRTPPTIFANAYKREHEFLLASGKEYSRKEIELQANKIQKYYKGYKINGNKRR